jgi:hypothetical protein
MSDDSGGRRRRCALDEELRKNQTASDPATRETNVAAAQDPAQAEEARKRAEKEAATDLRNAQAQN